LAARTVSGVGEALKRWIVRQVARAPASGGFSKSYTGAVGVVLTAVLVLGGLPESGVAMGLGIHAATVLAPASDTILKGEFGRPGVTGLRPDRPVRLGLGPAPLRTVPPVPDLTAGVPRLADLAPWLIPRVPRTELDPAARAPSPFERLAARDFVLRSAEQGGVASRVTDGAASSSGPEDPFRDLLMQVRTRGELGGDWNRFRPCTDRFQESCQPNLFPELSPDLNFAARISGTFLDRLTVDVDYDQLREFGETNRLQVTYEGGADAILKRLEVGDVDFRLPQSRFVTDGIPSGNFGFQMEGQFGPLDLRGVWAEQRGDLNSREFRLTGVGNQRRFVQEDTVVVDDADFQRGQFFFLVDPIEFDEYPHVDVLELDAGALPSDIVPGFDPIQLYRFENDPAARQQVEGYIQADAVLEARGDTVRESGWFRALIPGQEYFVHPSGLWVALRSPLTRDEMLAVTYITAAGDTVGDYNPEEVYRAGGRPTLKLLKATDANHQPGRATWELEMHQVYRVSASPDVEPASVNPVISLGEPSAGRTFERAPDGRDVTYLQLFGVDRESPLDRIDPAFVYTPGAELFQDPPIVPGTFLVFPTLRPFAEPPPNPTLGLDETEARTLLGDAANEQIYEAEDPFERRNGGLFRLTIPYRVRSEGVISTFSLGAFGVRQGSERIRLGDRELVRGIDYEISYDAGLVTLLQPDVLFSTDPDATIRATWEQQQLFRNAPTSVVGMVGHVGSPERGELDILALYQEERTVVTRPVLGLEPAAIALGGLGGRVERSMRWLDRALSAIPGVRSIEGSTFSLDGELAVSLPTPNTQGDVFLDDFDASDRRRLSLLSNQWTLGSAPSPGFGSTLPPVRPESLADLAWQHTWIVEGMEGDSVDIHEGFLPREEIDQQIRVAGSRVREPGLRLTFDPNGPAGAGSSGERFAGITTTLAPNGTDLTQTDFLEFYVAKGERATLLVDLGTVSEDAYFVAEGGATSGTKPNGIPWGLDRLDQEADPALGQIWGDELDRLGVWGETCESEPGRIFRLGDDRANCTRNNGRNDSEDLDGDGVLDTAERTLRWALELDGSSPYLVRNVGETGTDFRLYRIPIRDPSAIEVNGPFTESDLRGVRHIRFTVVADRAIDLTIARLALVGSRWIRRGPEGVLTGIVGDTAAFGGRVEVGPVSRLTEGDGYISPPGVLEQLADPTIAVGGQGIEFNERALSVSVDGLAPGNRAEVYTRYPQRPRNFLDYGEARLWVVPVHGDWDPQGDVRFFMKIGTGPENFYLYRTPLRTPAGAGVVQADWLPEVVIDFDVLIDLRRRAEEELIRRPRSSGDPPITLFSADSTYAIVLRDRGRAPDLANVREVSFGILNQGVDDFRGEVWINELRLDRGVRDVGIAGNVQATVRAGDLVESRFNLTTRGADFRQLRERRSNQGDRRVSLVTDIRLERFAPSGWGVEMPLSISWARRTLDPTFLDNSDVRADRIRDLRAPGFGQTRVTLGFRKVTSSDRLLARALLDGFGASVSTYRSDASSITSTVDTRGMDVRVGWDKRIAPREFDVVPSVVEPIVRALLPEGLEESVLSSRIRWAPERIEVGAAYARQDNEIRRYEAITTLPGDSTVEAVLAPREDLEAVAEIGFRPVPTLTAQATLVSGRDLLAPEEAVSDPAVQALIAAARRDPAGLNLGWETRRRLATRVGWGPRWVSWFTPDLTLTTRYSGDRNPTFVGFRTAGSDSVRALERNVRGERDLEGRFALDVGRILRAAGGIGEDSEAARSVLSLLRPLRLTRQDGVFARYNRDPVDPATAFQLGWTSLDGFRVIDADTAATFIDRTASTWNWGVAGSGGSLDFGYRTSEASTLDRRADRVVRRRVWPDIRGALSDLSLPESWALVLERVNLSTSVRRARTETVFGQAAQTRIQDEWNVPWDVTLTWVGSLVTSYRGSLLDGTGRDPTGDTERDRDTHRIAASSVIALPALLSVDLADPLRISLIGTYVGERECRVQRAGTECVAFVDQINRGLSFTMDTRVRDFEVGLQASYTDRQSFVGQRTGSTQFQVGLYGQFVFQAGGVPAPGAAGF